MASKFKPSPTSRRRSSTPTKIYSRFHAHAAAVGHHQQRPPLARSRVRHLFGIARQAIRGATARRPHPRGIGRRSLRDEATDHPWHRASAARAQPRPRRLPHDGVEGVHRRHRLAASRDRRDVHSRGPGRRHARRSPAAHQRLRPVGLVLLRHVVTIGRGFVAGGSGIGRHRPVGGRSAARRRAHRVLAVPPAWASRGTVCLRWLLPAQQRGDRRAVVARCRSQSSHDPGCRCPPRQRHAADLLSARRCAVRQHPHGPRVELPVVHRPCARARRRARCRDQPQPAASRRNDRRPLPDRPHHGHRRAERVRSRLRDRVARRRSCRRRSDGRPVVDHRRLQCRRSGDRHDRPPVVDRARGRLPTPSSGRRRACRARRRVCNGTRRSVRFAFAVRPAGKGRRS